MKIAFCVLTLWLASLAGGASIIAQTTLENSGTPAQAGAARTSASPLRRVTPSPSPPRRVVAAPLPAKPVVLPADAANTLGEPAAIPIKPKDPAKPSVTDNDSQSADTWFDFWPAIIGLIALLGLFGLLGWALFRLNHLEERHSKLRQEVSNNWKTIESSLNSLTVDFDEQSRELEALRSNSPALRKAELKAELLHELRASLPAANPRPAVAVPRERPSYAVEQYEPPPPKLWPAKVSVCLNRIGSDGLSVKRNFMRGDLLQVTATGSEDSLYVVARDPQQRSSWLVIPCLARFHSAQDYDHYSTFYECDRRAAGEVWVAEPARATYDENAEHWQLQQQGRLQIG